MVEVTELLDSVCILANFKYDASANSTELLLGTLPKKINNPTVIHRAEKDG